MQVDPIKPALKAPGTRRVETKIRLPAFKLWFQIQLAPLHHGRLIALKTLDLGKNRLTSVPAEFGRAVQLDPIKPKLKAPETQRLKLKVHELLSSFAFKFNLRRSS